jgi:hypothetical protein
VGLGSFWDPNEHPRGWHGRFAKKWKVSDTLRKLLDGFTPRTFQSDSQAGQYAFNQGHKNGPFSSVELTRLRKDWDEAQDHIRAGDMDPQTKAFDTMMQSHMRPTAEGLIATKTFGPDALGLRPDQLHDGPGGITDLFGTVLGDKAYGAVHLGTDVQAGQHGPGKITMTILVPQGTKAAFPGQSAQDRGFFLDKEQPLLITRVDPDGMGGWRLAAVAEPHPGTGSSEVSQDLNPGRKGVGLTPEERAARLAEPSTMPAPAAPPAAPATEAVMRPESVQAPAVGRTPEQEAARVARAQAGRQANVNEGNPPVQAPLPTPNPRAAPAPQPTAGPPSPTGVPDRNEPIHSPSIGATGTEGKSASEIANRPPAPAPEPPPALSPSEQGKSLKDAYVESGIESPAAGPHRAAFNRAYLNAKSEHGHPEQALRNLEADIKSVEQKAAEQKIHPSDRPDMATAEADAKSMNDLADLIATHFGLPRSKKQEEPKSPVQRAGGPDEFLGDKKPGAREARKVSGQPSRSATGLTGHEQAGSGPGTAGVGGRKAGAPEAPAPRGSSGKTMEERKSPGTAAGKITHGRIEPGDRVLVTKNDKGEWVPATKKTGATPLEVTGRDGASLVGKGPGGEEIKTRGERGHQTFLQHVEKAPKAPAAKKAAKAAAPTEKPLSHEEIAKRSAEMLARPAGGGGKEAGPLSEADHRDMLKANSKEQLRKIGEDLGVQVSAKDSKASMIDKIAPAAAADTAKRHAERTGKGGEDATGIRKMAKESDIPGDGGGLVGDAEARLKEGQSPEEVGKWLDSQAQKLTDDAAKDHSIKESDDLETKSRKRAMVQEANNNADKLRELADRVRGKGPEGQPASPSLEARQTADTAGVDRVLKAYNDIVARGDGHDRRVSIADIRAEVGGDLSRTELTRALREVGRGGSEHGGLLSRGVKPDARTEASGMDMGGEKVHFLQLPRPGEDKRGGEVVSHPKEEPAKAAAKAVKAAAKAAPKESGDQAEVAKVASAFHADWQKTQAPEGAGRKPKFKSTKDEAWIKAHGTDQVDIANTPYSDLPDDWQKENRDAAEVAQRILKEHGGTVDLTDEKTRLAVGEQIHQAWLSRENNSYAKGGELDKPFADLPRAEQDKDTDQLKVAMEALSPAKKAGPSSEAVTAARKAYDDIVARRGPDGDRKVSLQDIRQELDLQHSFSRPEVDKALKELGRGGSEHGGLISRATGKPSTREAAGAMKMGGEDVHFLQLPRPGEAARGGESTPSAPEAPTPEMPSTEAKSLDKMTKAELLAHPDAAGAKQSWTKDKIKQHIQDRQGTQAVSAATPSKAREAEVVARIQAAHRELENKTSLSSLADLRDKVGSDVSRAEFDKAITDISQTGLAQVVPESNQKTLTPRDREGAISLGNQDRHILRIAPGVTAEELNGDIAHIQSGGGRDEAPTAKRLDAERRRALGARAPRAAVPIDNEPRANEFTKAWDAAGIPEAPGSAGRSMKEIRKDLAEGKIDPAEGVRRMESEVSFNKDELSQVEEDLRAPDLTDKQRADLQAEHAKISEGIKAQEKASEFLRAHFGGEGDKPTVDEVKAKLPTTFGEQLKAAKPEEMDEVARIQGLDAPKGDTAEEKFDDLIRQTVEKELDSRQAAKTEKAAKAEATRLKKEAREAGKTEFRPGGEKHLDAAKIAEGLDTSDIGQYVDDAQTELNDGKTPKQVADRVRFMARGLADTNAIIHGSRDSRRELPEDKAAREAELATGRAKVAKLEELAKRIEQSKRPRKPRVSTKLTPTDHVAAKEAAKATGTPVAEVRSAMEDAKKADAKLQELGIPTTADELHNRVIARASGPFNDAKTAEEARRAAASMHGNLTLAEIRKMGAEHGITGRSKKDITDQIIARRFPPEPGAPSRLTGGQFDQLKAGDPIDIHLGGSKTRRDAVSKVDPDGTLHTKGGYKYGPTSDVQVSKAGGAPTRAESVTRAKKVSDVVAETHDLVGNGASPAAIRHRLDVTGQATGVDTAPLQALADNPAELTKAADKLAEEANLTRVGDTGGTVPFDRKAHDVAGNLDVPQGEPVRVTRPGHATGDGVTVSRPKVHPVAAEPAKVAKKAVPAKRVAKPGPAAEPRLSPEAEKARLEQERADNMARLAAAKAVPKKAAPAKAASGTRNKKTKDGSLIGPQDRTTSAGPGKLVVLSGKEHEMQPGDRLIPSPHRHAPGRYGVDLIKTDGSETHVEQDMTYAQAVARIAELNDFLGHKGASREGAPAKSVPAKKVAKAAPGEARIEASKFSDKPLREQTWGGAAKPGDLRYHESGAIGSALDSMGQDQRLDVGGEPLRNVLGQIATDVNRGTITPAQGLERYKALASRLPAGSKAKSALDRAIEQIDAPVRKPNLPEGTPDHIRKLAERLAEIPIARKDVPRSSRKGELDQVEALARLLTDGEPKSRFTTHEALMKMLDTRHESASDAGYGQILAAIRDALKDDEVAMAAARKAKRKE